MKIIHEASLAIKRNDTSLLYSLVDTARNFAFAGREEFIRKINLAREALGKCDANLTDSAVVEIDLAKIFTLYNVRFCIGGELTTPLYGVELSFRFANFEDIYLISRLDIVPHISADQPLIDAPK